MDPLTTAVATAVTTFLVDSGRKVADQLGQKAADAARQLAQTVLDRLGSDPTKASTVDQYKTAPAAEQASLEAALAPVIANDQAFADELKKLLAAYDPEAAARASIVVQGNATGPIQVGNDGIQIGTSNGTITINK
jgi:hypothetical protein